LSLREEEAIVEKRGRQKHSDCCSCWSWKDYSRWCHAQTN